MQNLETEKKFRIVNLLLCVSGSVICVSLANNWALLVALLVLIIHTKFSLPGEWRFIIQVTVIGWLFDSILFRTGVMGGNQLFPPIWLTAMWPIFATTICHSLRFCTQHLAYSPIMGAIFGLLVYFLIVWAAGISFIQPIGLFGLIIALSWGLIFPLISFIAMSRVIALSD